MTPSNFVIEELNLIKFGKFENKKLDLKSGFNVIYGSNESGKSTIQLFIKAMLYGLPSRKKKDEALKERERAIPWGETRAEGMMKLRVDGRLVEIRRRIGKTAAGDKVEICDSLSGEILTEYGDNIGEVLLGIPSGVFEKTLWIGQGAVSIGGDDENLSARLMNIQSSGDEDMSADAALAKLEAEKRALKAKNGRNSKGRIDILLGRREDCVRKRYDLATQLAQTEHTRIRLAEAAAEQKAVEEEIAALTEEYKKSSEAEKLSALRERLARVDEFRQKIDEIINSEEYIKAGNIDEQDIDTAFELEKEISLAESRDSLQDDFSSREELLIKKKSKASAMLGGGTVLCIAAIISAAAAAVGGGVPTGIAAAACLLIGIPVIISGIKSSRKCKNIISSINEDKQRSRIEMQQRIAEEQKLRDSYNKLLMKYNAENAADIQKRFEWRQAREEVLESHKSMLQGFLGRATYEELKDAASANSEKSEFSTAELDEKLSAGRNRLIELVAEIKSAESKMAYEVKISELPADIDTEIAAIDSEIRECERRLEVIEYAEAALREASDVFRLSFAPVLCEKVNSVTEKLTGGKYSGIRVSEDYHMRVDTDSNLYDAEYFSFGTYEQLYFALRLAAAELICGCTPMFLDDILTAYDNERALAALKFLAEEADRRQVVLFTCHETDKAASEGMSAHIINLN